MACITALFLVLLISGISQYYFGKTLINISMDTPSEAHLQLTLFGLAVLLFGSILVYDANVIRIDTLGKLITFRNIITQKIKSYSFDTLDGYVDTLQRDGRGNSYKTIYLVKDKKYIAKISNFYCSNYDELKDGLSKLTYLGFQNFNIIDSFRVLFGMDMVD
jgi:hypothetical protein